ncbi:DNA cytosine methyltransferase [Caldimonas sp. KR1-144]|uniref:DNA cytosine methyltransferase n=1 Tax=Caldimonas sp. KR1-144 TaxID=3400911 RepID=UPI003BFE4F2D
MTFSRVRKKVLCLFGAVGGGALGFKRAVVRMGMHEGTWECIGSIDVDEGANRVFARRVGAPATTIDLADRSQYIAIHGHEPPPVWREATPEDIRRAAGGMRPDCIFLSAPCKGFSGLLSEAKSTTAKYVAMNGLAERGLWLALEAWADDPVPLILFENVPRLLTRGRPFVDQLIAMQQAFGYATAETVHDCGELGNLAQSRKRCLIVGRHMAKVPNFLYEPPKRPLRAVGDVLSKMDLPGVEAAGPMHRVPNLQWKTWVRLAFVEAGSDWRSLNKLAIEDGHLRDFVIVPEMHNGVLGVRDWHEPAGTVTGNARPGTGSFSVADPRFDQSEKWHDGHSYGVRRWDEASSTVTAKLAPGSGYGTVADPRCGATKHNNCFKVVRFDQAAGTVTAGGHPSAGGQAVADPRPDWNRHGNNLCVMDWEEPSRTVIAGGKGVQGGWLSVADPRSGMAGDREAYLTGGHYGVLPWGEPAGAVAAAACHDNGRWSVADPRMPEATDKLVARIRALDGTWHRPFTTLELAALQSLFDPDDPADVAAFTLAFTSESKSDSVHREWTGNAVPPDGATPIAEEMLRTLMLADAGETFQLSASPIWVRPVVAALMLAQGSNP